MMNQRFAGQLSMGMGFPQSSPSFVSGLAHASIETGFHGGTISLQHPMDTLYQARNVDFGFLPLSVHTNQADSQAGTFSEFVGEQQNLHNCNPILLNNGLPHPTGFEPKGETFLSHQLEERNFAVLPSTYDIAAEASAASSALFLMSTQTGENPHIDDDPYDPYVASPCGA
jgi:hypothetical protein